MTWFLLLAGLLLGAVGGAHEARRSTAACSGSLATGEPVSVTGIVANRNRTGTRSRRLIRIRRAWLYRNDQRCFGGQVITRVQPTAVMPALGSQVRVAGEWMQFDDGGGMVTGTLTESGPGEAMSLSLHARSLLSDRMDARLPVDVVPTALALLLAERDEMDPDLRRRYAAAGMAHLLAVSGMHVGLLALGITWCLGMLSPGHRRRFTLLLLVGYVLMIGSPVAARRALVLLAGYFWATGRGWPARSGELAGLAGLLILIADPRSLLDAGFQLSFAGFSGVLVGLRLCGPARAAVLRVLVVSSCAFVATSPFTAWHFGQVTPVALLSHVVAGPLVAASLASLVAAVSLPAPLWFFGAQVATGSIRLLDAIAGWFSAVPLGHVGVGPPGLGIWVAWILVGWSAHRFLRTRLWRAAVTPVALAMPVLAFGPIQPLLHSRHALICTLSVGQGDAAVLRTRRGHWLVFDGGPSYRDWDAGSAIVLPFLRRHGATHIELAILSHPDLDHVGGLIGLLGRTRITRVLDSGDPLPSAPYQRFLMLVDATGTNWLPAVSGDSLSLDGVKILILGPDGRRAGAPGGANETSIVFRVEFEGGFRYLNTGDATAAEERDLLGRWPAATLRSDLLKIGHHGSRTSSAVSFLETVRPSVAVISSGATNRYGHPHAETLARLDSANVPRIWRTDRNGSLCIEIDESGRWRVSGEGRWRIPGAAP